jgi:integrase
VTKRQDVALGKTHDMLNHVNLWKLEDGEYRDRRYLFFVVRNEGKSRKWVFRYTWRLGKVSKVKKIDTGTFPKVSLAEARATWTKYKNWLAQSPPKDPKVMLENEIDEAATEAVTVKVYLEKLKKKKRSKRLATREAYKRHWDKIEKIIGDRAAITVTRRELLEKFKIEEMHYATPLECKTLCIQLKGIFGLVHDDFQERMPVNVGARLVSGFQPVDEIRKVKHAPPWPPEDHAPFIKACREHKVHGGPGNGTRPDVSLLTECLFLTAVRPREIREATWDEIHLDDLLPSWHIPFHHRKNGGLLDGKVRPIPISPSVEIILREMKRRYPKAKKTDVIFPASRNRKNGEPFMSDDTIYLHIHESLRWHKPLNPHSARNGFVAWARQNQIYIPFIERQLDHALPEDPMARDLRGPYEQELYMKKRTEVMTAFDEHCNRLEPVSQTATILPIRRSA